MSRVIQNRLDQGMILQFDSTVHYGIGDDSVVTTTDADRNDASNPYNTYVHAGGLPPGGPIGNPGGAEAIAAALNPEPRRLALLRDRRPPRHRRDRVLEHARGARGGGRAFNQWLIDHPRLRELT